MNSFLTLLLAAFRTDVKMTVRKTKRQAILYAILGLFAITTYVLAVAAIIAYAAIYIGIFEAILAGALVSGATCLLLIAIISFLSYRDRRRTGTYNTVAVARAGAASFPSASDHIDLKKLAMVAAASFAATKFSQSRK